MSICPPILVANFILHRIASLAFAEDTTFWKPIFEYTVAYISFEGSDWGMTNDVKSKQASGSKPHGLHPTAVQRVSLQQLRAQSVVQQVAMLIMHTSWAGLRGPSFLLMYTLIE